MISLTADPIRLRFSGHIPTRLVVGLRFFFFWVGYSSTEIVVKANIVVKTNIDWFNKSFLELKSLFMFNSDRASYVFQ